jgi:hypothetical protein
MDPNFEHWMACETRLKEVLLRNLEPRVFELLAIGFVMGTLFSWGWISARRK